MSKRTRRQRRPNLPPEAFNSPVAAASASSARSGAVAPTSAPAAAAMARKVANVNWHEEYGEVMGDLKRTGVLFVVLMAAMGVLSLIVR